MVETIVGDISFVLVMFFLTDEFNPVAIGIQAERNILHPSLGKFLLEFNAELFKSRTRMFQRTHRDTNLHQLRPKAIHVQTHYISYFQRTTEDQNSQYALSNHSQVSQYPNYASTREHPPSQKLSCPCRAHSPLHHKPENTTRTEPSQNPTFESTTFP
jgi:hypothetical protein